MEKEDESTRLEDAGDPAGGTTSGGAGKSAGMPVTKTDMTFETETNPSCSSTPRTIHPRRGCGRTVV